MVGIGYRKDFAEDFLIQKSLTPDFIEVAPENWMEIGGFWKKTFDAVVDQYPLFTHGLSLSIGSPDPLDLTFLKKLKLFLNQYNPKIYSEHISYSRCNNAHLYDLLPIPFTTDAVLHISERINQVQDILERPLTLEIVSYYTNVEPELSELEFINSILTESKCQLLLDVNNIYVNSFNHNYNPYEFIDQLLLDKVAYVHMAGHEQVSSDLIIDTHGQPIINPVFKLFEHAMNKLNKDVPVLLERDFNIPDYSELQKELNLLKSIKKSVLKPDYYVA